jgi:hypothetical protein
MNTIAVISPGVAALGSETVDLIVRSLIAFDEYLKRDEPMITDFESEWPSDYGCIHFVINRWDPNPTRTPDRTLKIQFRTERLEATGRGAS